MRYLNTSEEMPDYNSVYKLDDFIEACKNNEISDYDGCGYYMKDNLEYRSNEAVPSQINEGIVLNKFTHVIWYWGE